MITIQDLNKEWKIKKEKIMNLNDWNPYETDSSNQEAYIKDDHDFNYSPPLILDDEDNLINELRYLWNTRYKRYKIQEEEIEKEKKINEEKLYSLVQYNTFKVHPSYFSKGPLYDREEDSDHSEYFSYSTPKYKNLICAKGVRKTADRNNHDLALLNRCKVGRPKKDKLEKKYYPKSNIRGRPKNSKKKNYFQMLIEQEKLYELENIKEIKKILKKPYKKFKFKKTWKIKKSEWKRISAEIEPIIQKNLKGRLAL